VIQDIIGVSARLAGAIAAEYAADDSPMAYSAIDLTPYGFSNRDVIVGDELGFTGVPVGLLAEDLVTEEIWEIYRGTRVIANGPNEWKVDGQVWLSPCPFAPGCRTHSGFTTTESTFRRLSGDPFPVPQGISGHSLAAAWGLLRAARLRANLISFAGPKVGDREWADFAVQAIPTLVRWVDHPDIVPKVPIEIFPLFEYMHAGPANEFDATPKIAPSLSLPDAVSAYHNIYTYWNAVDPNTPILPQYAAAIQ
jgi:hypothetical protein